MSSKIKKYFDILAGLRGRLTLLYASLMALMIVISTLFFYNTLKTRLNNDVDHQLIESVTEYSDAANKSLASKKDLASFSEKFLKNHVFRPSEMIIIKTADGQFITTSSQADFLLALPENRKLLSSSTKKGLLTLKSPKLGDVRIISAPITLDRKNIGMFQTAIPLSTIKTTLNDSLVSIMISSFITLAIVSILGFFLAGAALSPLIKISETVKRISRENLKERIEYDGPQDEVGSLVQTFNEMIARLDRAFKEQKQFITNASHELRTPITIAKGNLELLAQINKSPDHEFLEMIDVSLDELNRMGRLVNDLLVLTKANQSDFLSREKFDLEPFLKNVFIKAKNLAKRKWCLEKIPSVTIEADKDKLTQAILNLIQNAVNHTKEQDSITLLAEIENKWLKITVDDTGIGIPIKDQKNIFERFYRATNSRSRDVGGSGLGLSIVQAIVEAHNGKIELASKPGKQTSFTISLPL